MQLYFILATIAALCIVPTLIAGVWKDVKTRTFPSAYWNITGKVSGLFLILSYLLMIADGLYVQTEFLIIGSVLAAYLFAFIGYRFTSGGDWRALIYISVLAPTILFTFTFWVSLCLASLGVAFVVLAKKDTATHLFKRHIPWSLAICIGYCVTLAFVLLTGGAG